LQRGVEFLYGAGVEALSCSLMLGKRPLQKWSGELAFSTEREFERKVLPFLHLFWPELVQPPARQTWDSKGIDLAVWTDAGSLPVAVQCKGFSVQEIGSDQLRQAMESITTFERSDVVCDTYLFLHNRDGRNPEFRLAVEDRLRSMVASGRVREAFLWDRQKLLAKAFERLQHLLEERLREHAQQLLCDFQERFGSSWVARVPLVEDRLVFQRDEPCKIESVSPCERRHVSQLMLSSDESRWTLLTGPFGSGKTTSLLHCASAVEQVVLFIEARHLPFSELRRSTNLLLEQIVTALNLLGDFSAEDRTVLAEIAGPAFHDLLQNTESPYVLIVDGLDENRAYATFEGLQTLSNQLSSVRCPIVLATRQEHLFPLFGSFSSAFYEFSTKHGPTRAARLLTLAPWTMDEVLDLINQVRQQVHDEKRRRAVEDFGREVASGRSHEWYADLPFRPLFLQFILDDLMEEGLRHARRSDLLVSWVQRKIRRDVRARGLMLDSTMDVEDFVARMLNFAEDVAHALSAADSGAVVLLESGTVDLIAGVSRRHFPQSAEPTVPLLLNSVLMPLGLRRGSELRVAFAFRIFHEYFLARYAVRESLERSVLPENVRSLAAEMST
jgi:energy-coupling factor transporter ATP-binding protein EcfA2